MFNLIHRFALRRLALATAIALLPMTAFAWGSQAGDNGRQPLGADNEGPRQSVPNATTNDPIDYQAGTAYYSATTAHQRALYYCDQKPIALQDACRDAADARYGYPSARTAYVSPSTGTSYVYTESYPSYMTYYYSSPTYPNPTYYRYDTYAVGPDYYVVYPDAPVTPSMNSLNRCAPLLAAARAECLHGSTPGG
jgi:hypothetical protein